MGHLDQMEGVQNLLTQVPVCEAASLVPPGGAWSPESVIFQAGTVLEQRELGREHEQGDRQREKQRDPLRGWIPEP